MWHMIKQHGPPDTNRDVHVFSPKTGQHTGWFAYDEWTWRPHDPFDPDELTHWHEFPNDPVM